MPEREFGAGRYESIAIGARFLEWRIGKRICKGGEDDVPCRVEGIEIRCWIAD